MSGGADDTGTGSEAGGDAGFLLSGGLVLANGIVVRGMVPADRRAVVDLLWELNRFEERISRDRATDRAAAKACLAANDALMRGAHGGLQAVAERGGAVIGYLCCAIQMGPAYLKPAERLHGFVTDLVVADKARGLGVGAALLEAAEGFVRGHGLATIALGVLVGNEGAGRFYERQGYRPYAVERLKRLD